MNKKYEVSVNLQQDFTAAEQAQGRSNIGAASASDVTALQSQVSSLSDVSAYSVKGEATVAQLNAGPSGIQAGWAYQLTDSGTLTAGSLAVVAGDTVAWDGTKWFPLVKSDYYATKTYAQNVAHSIAPEFDPTKPNDDGGYAYYAGTPVMYNGSNYVFTSDKKSGNWDPAVVEKKPLSESIQLEGVGEAVNEWLNEHPEATTTVEDGSLTEEKFSDALKLQTIKDYVTPEMFGAKGDGVTNDTQALQDAIDSGKTVFLTKNKTYATSHITLKSKTTLIGVDSIISCIVNSGTFVTVEYSGTTKVTIKGIHFKAPVSHSDASFMDFGTNSSFFVLEDLVIQNFKTAFSSTHLFWFNVLRNVRLIHCDNGFIGGGSINISNIFDTCYFGVDNGYSLDLTTFKVNLFINCACQSSYGPWAAFRENCDGIVFESCNFEYCRLDEDEACIEVHGTSNIKFDTCYFHDGNRKDDSYTNTVFMEINDTAKVTFEKCYLFGNIINNYFRTSNNSNEKYVVYDLETLNRMINAFSVRSGDTSIIFSLSDVIKTATRARLPNEFNGALWYNPTESALYFYLNGVYRKIDADLKTYVDNNIFKCNQYAAPVQAKWRKVLLSYNQYDAPGSTPKAATNSTYQVTDLEYNPYSNKLRCTKFVENGVDLETKYMKNPSTTPSTGTYTLKIVDGTIQWVQDA